MQQALKSSSGAAGPQIVATELLGELDTARRQLFTREGKSAELDLISKSFANLLRMWVED